MLLAGTNSLALCLVFAVLLLCSGGQAIHGYLRIVHANPRTRKLAAIYESSLLVHMMLMGAFALGSINCLTEPMLHFIYASIPLQPALWVNVAIAIVAVYATLAGIEEDEMPAGVDDPSWMPAVDAMLVLLCTPPATWLLGQAWAFVLYMDAAYFLFRTIYVLIVDKRVRRRMVSSLSIAEAVKLLPEGILYADQHGRTIIANDTMRHCLSAVGLSTDFGRVDDLWTKLNELAQGAFAAPVSDPVDLEPGSWVILQIAPEEVRLFSFEGEGFDQDRAYPSARPLETGKVARNESKYLLGGEVRTRVIAYDVTRQIEILREIDRTNAELVASQISLQSSMDTVQEAAENEAMLRMRGRVHDVIGQRLSMLHRALEDEDVSDETLDQLKPLLNGILDDLAASSEIDPSDELEASVNAFSLTGVNVVIEGSLPDDQAIAKLFVDCIREGATNAVKHAHAARVDVTIGEHQLEIRNDGTLPDGPVIEGTGLRHMRQVVTSLGGTLDIESDQAPFTRRVTVP